MTMLALAQAVEHDRQCIELRAITGATIAEIRDLAMEAEAIARQDPEPSTTSLVMSAQIALAQQGLSVADISENTETCLYLARRIGLAEAALMVRNGLAFRGGTTAPERPFLRAEQDCDDVALRTLEANLRRDHFRGVDRAAAEAARDTCAAANPGWLMGYEYEGPRASIMLLFDRRYLIQRRQLGVWVDIEEGPLRRLLGGARDVEADTVNDSGDTLLCVFCAKPGRIRAEGFAPECDVCAGQWED